MREEHASLAKAFCTRESRGRRSAGRESCSAETGFCWITTSPGLSPTPRPIYSYEGTREINTLVVGRAITGFGAFV